MSEMHGTEHVPGRLKESDLSVIIRVLGSKKASKVVAALCDNEKSDFDQIQDRVGGSKTSTLETLEMLEGLNIAKSEWELIDVGSKGQPKRRAVKAFGLSGAKEGLVRFYEPFFRRIDQVF